jgi:uncharacterized NAD(P)/FAD-binding protein YdhS
MTVRCQRIAIIGGGFTGTALTIELLRRVSTPLEILLIDRRGHFGRGLAYGTQDDNHLLNVAAAKMSLLDGEPRHFVSWLATTRGNDARDEKSWEQVFVSRKDYGEYLQASLQAAIATAAPEISVRFITDHITAIHPNERNVAITGTAHGGFRVDRAILCLGNPPPATPSWQKAGMRAAKRIINDPWAPAALDAIAPDDDVVLVGSGLTAIDIALSLVAGGHRAPLHAISRHGLLPRVHSEHATAPWLPDLHTIPVTARGQLRWLRGEIARAAKRDIDWRSVIDAVRPHAQMLWSALPLAERRKFLSRLRTYWDIHRHRMSPTIGQRLTALRDAGCLRVSAGGIARIESDGGRLRVSMKQRHGNATAIGTDWIINCTGPTVSYRTIADPLIRCLVDSGNARTDRLALGFDITSDHRVIDDDGVPSPVLYALGPVTRGVLWEITAVPDIRTQCASLAATLADALDEETSVPQWMMRDLSLASAAL